MSSVRSLVAAGAEVFGVVFVAGATSASLPFKAERGTGAAKEQLSFDPLGDGLVSSIPGFERVAVEYAVRVTPEADGTN